MADSTVAPVTRQGSWGVLGLEGNSLFTDTGALSAPAAYAHRNTSSMWPSVLTGSGERISIERTVLESNSLGLSFFGEDGGGSAPYHAIGALWMARKLTKDTDTEFRGTFLGEFELILGEQQRAGTGGILPDDVKWVKSITPVKDRALFPGIRIVGQEENGAAEMYLDGLGA